MIRTQKGFTLVELLVAATIIGILAVFATVQYRNTAAETRWQEAKAKVELVANAVQRARLDYPVKFSDAKLLNSAEGSCTYPTEAQAPSWLIKCNYLDNVNWQDNYFAYYVCSDNQHAVGCHAKTSTFEPLACVIVNNTARVPAKYYQYRYCIKADGTGSEETNNTANVPNS